MILIDKNKISQGDLETIEDILFQYSEMENVGDDINDIVYRYKAKLYLEPICNASDLELLVDIVAQDIMDYDNPIREVDSTVSRKVDSILKAHSMVNDVEDLNMLEIEFEDSLEFIDRVGEPRGFELRDGMKDHNFQSGPWRLVPDIQEGYLTYYNGEILSKETVHFLSVLSQEIG